MTEDTLSKLGELARGMLQTDGDLMPVLFVNHEGETDILGIAEMPRTHDERARLMFEIGQRYREQPVDSVIFISDAYTKMQRASELLPFPAEPLELRTALKDDPEATECILLVEMKADGTSTVDMHRYTRVPTLEQGLLIEFEPVERMTEGKDGESAKMYLIDQFYLGALS